MHFIGKRIKELLKEIPSNFSSIPQPLVVYLLLLLSRFSLELMNETFYCWPICVLKLTSFSNSNKSSSKSKSNKQNNNNNKQYKNKPTGKGNAIILHTRAIRLIVEGVETAHNNAIKLSELATV